MTRSKRQLRVFLIYAHSNQGVVHKLYTRLVKDGMEVWVDKEKLQPGQNWEYEIHKAILKSDVVIVCLSQAFNKQKGYRHKELKIALKKATLLDEGEIYIIPARLEKCKLPAPLCHLQRIDLFEANGYRKLIRALQRQVDSR